MPSTANKELLLIAIRNLHENATRHMPKPGAIRWSMERSAEALTVFIEDEGPGISDDEIALVTNRFFRGRNKSALGSGLGYRSSTSRCAPAAPDWSSRIGSTRAACARKSFGRLR